MAVLKEKGVPLKTAELYELMEEKHPGLVRSPNHLKKKILKSALINKVMRVRYNDSTYKEYWSPRKPGQIRMRWARRRKNRTYTIQHSDQRRDKKGRRVPPSKRWPPRKWFAPQVMTKPKVKQEQIARPKPGDADFVQG